ncbi:glycoside hydrolase family 15 protein [Pseudomonas sp. HK3]
MSENKKSTLSATLDAFYSNISATILAKQDPITGLFPASTAINEHGNYQDAWVRDNVYSIQAVWGLALAYESADIDSQRTYLLNHSVVRLMRGLLVSMMRQAEKVETFKHNQDPLFALHAKYDTPTGATVVDDDKWGHLQFDATAIYLIMLVRMISAGLDIILSVDEVNFIQNLIHYIGPAYRTGDYGIWERGNKINNGRREINASSVGMVKSALELLNGFNLFGKDGAELGVVHVIDDEIARARTTLQNLLPRESVSKEVDAALLSIIGYPAFSVEEPEIAALTNQKVLDKLAGEYGCKRFLLDGHQSVLEDHSRFYYKDDELKNFKDIESEWPLFYTYLYLNSLFNQNLILADEYYKKLESLAVEQNGQMLLPELYYVPLENVEAEKQTPHSQKRTANNNLPLVWAQSLFYLARLLHEKLISPEQLDPQNLSKRTRSVQARSVHVCLIASDASVQNILNKQGITSNLESELTDITLCATEQLLNVYSRLGSNKRLGLTGRPMRVLRSMATSRLYEINDQKYLFLPNFQYQKSRFYMSLDNNLFAQRILSEANYLSRHWQSEKDPVMTMYVDQSMLNANTKENVLTLFKDLSTSQGHVRLGNLVEFLPKINTEVINGLESFDLIQYHPGYDALDNGLLTFKHEKTVSIDVSALTIWSQDVSLAQMMVKLSQSENLYEQVLLLSLLERRFTSQQVMTINNQDVSLKDLIKEVYAKSCQLRLWSLVRQCAGLLDIYHQELSSALSEILARQKHLVLGRGYSGYKVIADSMESDALYHEIAACCGQDPKEKSLIQEILIHLATIIRSEPLLFKNVAALRTTDLLLMLTSEMSDEQHETQDLSL